MNKVELGQHSKGKSDTICKVKNRAELSRECRHENLRLCEELEILISKVH